MMNRQDRARWLDEDGECRMCRDGEWPLGADNCPVCDADVPDEVSEYQVANRRPIPNFPDYAIDNTGVVWRMTPSVPQVEARCGPAPRALRAVNVTNGRSARKHACVRLYEPNARRACMRSVAKLMRDIWPEVVL